MTAMMNLLLPLLLSSGAWFGALAITESDAQAIFGSVHQTAGLEKVYGDNSAYYCGLKSDQLFTVEEFNLVPNPPPV